MSAEFDSGLFTNNEVAWHGLGHVITEKCYNVQEAITMANMDWTVGKRPLYHDNGYEFIEMPGRYCVVREDNGFILNPSVSDTYNVLQNSEAFSYFEPFLHEKECFISAMVALNQGKKICLVVEIEDNEREIVIGDNVKSYMIFATSHDGSLASIIKFTHIRVVCQNTLHSALSRAGAFRSVKHQANQKDLLADIQASVNIFKKDFDEQVSIYKAMADKAMDLDATRSYLERLFESELTQTAKAKDINTEDVSLEDCRITRNCLENYMFTPDLQLEGVEGTAWAAFNSVTEAIKTRSSNPDNRLNSIWFGPDAKLIHRAKELVLAI